MQSAPLFLFCCSLLLWGSWCEGVTVREWAVFPVERIVLSNVFVGGTAVSDRTSLNQFEAIGQIIESEALNGDPTTTI